MDKIIRSIKKRPVNIILICLVVVLYIVNNIWLKCYMPFCIRWFFVCYFNDLICPLLFFSYCNILLVTVDREIISLKTIFLLGIVISIVWEYGAPLLKDTSTADVLDIVCYLIGSIFYWCILQRNLKNE